MKKVVISGVFLLMLFCSLSAQTVYITKTGKKYHSSECSSLSRSKIEIPLSEAVDRGYTPCSRCSPPSKTSNSNVNTSNSTVRNSNSQNVQNNSSGRCQATTKKGTQCKRKAQPGSDYCWQHSR